MTVHYIRQTCADSRQLLSHSGVGPTVAVSSSLGYGKVTERLCEKENGSNGVRMSRVTIYTILLVRHKSRLLWPCPRSALFVPLAVCHYAHHNKAIWSYSGLLWRAAKCEESRRTTVADTKASSFLLSELAFQANLRRTGQARSVICRFAPPAKHL